MAVLIDAENVPAKYADPLFGHLSDLGHASVRRIFGDFASPLLAEWTKAASRHGILIVHTPAVTSQKNSADIALVIDAMDLLARADFEAFCLVSSDSDFTRLAMRIREAGIAVHGFGEAKSSACFRAACDTFHVLDKAPGTVAPALGPQGGAKSVTTLPPAADAKRILVHAAAKCKDSQGWYRLSEIGSRAGQISPGFSARTYGRSLSSLVKESGAFEFSTADPQLVRLKSEGAKAARKAS